jgi:hypothetical protein
MLSTTSAWLPRLLLSTLLLPGCGGDDDDGGDGDGGPSGVDAGADTGAGPDVDAGGPGGPDASTLLVCMQGCSSPADCGGDSPWANADNFACTDGACRYLGCKDGECSAGYVCHAPPSGVPTCSETCTSSSQCAVGPAGGIYDADNFACADGACVYLGCRNDTECANFAPNRRCRLDLELPECVLGCSTPVDCAFTIGPPYDADHHSCEGGLCIWLGCKDDSECMAKQASFVCRPES